MLQGLESRREGDLHHRITLRPACEGDEPFLFRLFCTVREPDFALLDESDRKLILRMQYAAQQRHLQDDLPDAKRMIVLLDGKAAGSLITICRFMELHLIEIALLPEHRCQGIGSILMEGLGRIDGKELPPVSLNVHKQSRAVGFYRRMGFLATKDDGVYLFMKKSPETHRRG